VSAEQKEKQEYDTTLNTLVMALDIEKKRSEEYLNRLKYMQADFDNLRKRVERQIDDVKRYCNERLIIALLDVVDELELAVKSGNSPNSRDAFIQGVGMTLKKLKKLLEIEEVYPIECVGKSFDPSKHNVSAEVEKGDVEECTIVEEVRKGYTFKDKVIRPSIVKIAVKSASKSQMEMNSNE
jgi:molecular chaperone GrpE